MRTYTGPSSDQAHRLHEALDALEQHRRAEEQQAATATRDFYARQKQEKMQAKEARLQVQVRQKHEGKKLVALLDGFDKTDDAQAVRCLLRAAGSSGKLGLALGDGLFLTSKGLRMRNRNYRETEDRYVPELPWYKTHELPYWQTRPCKLSPAIKGISDATTTYGRASNVLKQCVANQLLAANRQTDQTLTDGVRISAQVWEHYAGAAGNFYRMRSTALDHAFKTAGLIASAPVWMPALIFLEFCL